MRNFPAGAPPVHELPLIVTENGVKSIYATHMELTQADMGYELPLAGKGRPAAPHHLHVYADTVVLGQPLVLPGKDVGIFARSIVLSPGAQIDVSGATADKTFAAGDLPKQTKQDPGADGATGADASAGGAAGSVTIAAETIAGSGDGTLGIPRLDAFNMRDALKRTFARFSADASAAIDPFTYDVRWFLPPPNPFDDAPRVNPYDFTVLKGALGFAKAPLTGLNQMTVKSCLPSEDGLSATLLVSAPQIQCAIESTLTVERIDSPYLVKGDTVSLPIQLSCALEIAIDMRVDPQRWKVSGAPVRVTIAAVTVAQWPENYEQTLFSGVGACVAQVLTRPGEGLIARVRSAVTGGLQKFADAMVAAVNAGLRPDASIHLVVRAKGGAGGRGQDGHAGIKGVKGIDGTDSNTIVDDLNGLHPVPPETVGQKGSKGGRAGSAGTSGAGGKGGVISINYVKSWPVRIVLWVDGGAGGLKASPGAAGEGGDGGIGGSFTVRLFRPMGNEAETSTGPAGARGDQGDLPEFARGAGTAGPDGTMVVNTVDFTFPVDPRFPALTYRELAPCMKLEQLLMIQREGKLAYLNASSAADYARAGTLFKWLCDIAPDEALAADAENGLSLEDRNARGAIRAAAQVELLRLQRGLDFFGHPYNWAPILRLSHIQARTTELITLGQLVEQRHSDYLDTNRSVNEKLAALDETSRALAGDLGNADSAKDVLDKRIVLAERVMASLQKDIDDQISVMQRHRTELEAEIAKEAGPNCGMDNVVKIVGALVAIGAGAFNGVSEIAGAAELVEVGKAAKEAAEGVKQMKAVVEKIQKSTASVAELAGKLGAVNDAIAANKPDSVKIVVSREDFEDSIKPLLEKFPDKTKELRSAVRAFFDLALTRNEKVLAYNALFVQKAALATHCAQVRAQIASINAIKSENKGALVPVPYLTFFKSALGWSRQNLIEMLYAEIRAFCYHTGNPRKDLLERLIDLNIAALADTQAHLLMDYDAFLTKVGRPYSPLIDLVATISKADQPSAFEALPATGRITFTLTPTLPHFSDLTLVKMDAVGVRLPGVSGGPNDELNVALMMMGESVVRPVDEFDPSAIVPFNCDPRAVSFKYSYDPARKNPVVEPGVISDHDFTPLSPFTTWTLDFGLKDGLNGFVDLAKLETIELHFTGHAFGRQMKAAAG